MILKKIVAEFELAVAQRRLLHQHPLHSSTVQCQTESFGADRLIGVLDRQKLPGQH